MKLRLPHKFQAALLAAIASVSFTTLSTSTLGAAFFLANSAAAEDSATADEDEIPEFNIGYTDPDASPEESDKQQKIEVDQASIKTIEVGSNGGPGNNAGLLITESVDIDETALDAVVSSDPVAVTSGSADSTPSDDLGFTSNPYATGSDTSNGSDDFSLPDTAPAAAYVPGQPGISAEEGDSAAGTGSGSSTNKTTTGGIGSIGGIGSFGSGAIGGSVARPMALTASNMLSPVSSFSVGGSSLGGDAGSASPELALSATLGDAGSSAASPISTLGNIMYIGDSITNGHGGRISWRWDMFKLLTDNGVTQVEEGIKTGRNGGDSDHVGATYGGSTFANRHSAQSSGRAWEISGRKVGSRYDISNIKNWLGQSGTKTDGQPYTGNVYSDTAPNATGGAPDTFVMMIGINDFLSDGFNNEYDVHHNLLGYNQATDSFDGKLASGSGTCDYDVIYNSMRTANPDAVIYISKLTPEGSSGNCSTETYVNALNHFNNLLVRWAAEKNTKDGQHIVVLDPNAGIVDVTNSLVGAVSKTVVPGFGNPAFYDDGLHPSVQGELIISGNIAKGMGLGGRTAGQYRKAATDFSQQISAVPAGATNVTLNDDGALDFGAADASSATFAWDSADLSHGSTVEFSLLLGNGETGGWNTTTDFAITLDDGSHAGTLNINEAYIKWGSKLLYSQDASLQGNDAIRIAYVNGNAAESLDGGFYVWLGDMMIGEALSSSSSTAAGVTMSYSGSGTALVSSLAMEGTGSFAPNTSRSYNADYAFISAGNLDTKNTSQGIKVVESWTPLTEGTYANTEGSWERSATVSGNYTGAVRNTTVEGNVDVLYSGNNNAGANQGVIAVFEKGATVNGNVYLQFDAPNATYGHWTGAGGMAEASASLVGTYNGAINGSFTAVINAGSFDSSIYGGAYNDSRTITGGTNVYVNNGNFAGNVFGGGKSGTIQNGAHVTVTGGQIAGSVYGGGSGGSITGGTSVTVTGGFIAGDVYGGMAGETDGLYTGSVTVQDNLAVIQGNIYAAEVTFKDISAGTSKYSPAHYAGQINATDTFNLDHYTAEDISAAIVTKNLVLKNGTKTTIRDLKLTACTITVEDTSEGTIAGTLTLGNTATYTGDLTLAGGLVIDMSGSGSGSVYSDGENGFREASEITVMQRGTSGSLDVDPTKLTGAGSLLDSTFNYDSSAGTLTAAISGETGTYFVNSGTVVYGGPKSAKGITTATKVQMQPTMGATLELAQNLSSTCTDGVVVASSAVNPVVKIDKFESDGTTRIVLDQADLHANAAVKLAGDGTFALAANSFGLPEHVSLDSDWAGIIRVSTASEQKGFNLSALANANSWIEFNGVTGWTTNWAGTNTQNIMLSDPENGVAWYCAASTTKTDKVYTATYTGKFAGDGTFQVNPDKLGYTFTGDVSAWTGKFLNNDDTSGHTSTLTFEGAANTINAAIENTGNQMKLVVNNNATFNRNVTGISAGLTVANGKHATFNGTTSISGASTIGGTIYNNGDMTLAGTGTINLSGNESAFELYKGAGSTNTYDGAGGFEGNGHLTNDTAQYYIIKGGADSSLTGSFEGTILAADGMSLLKSSAPNTGIYYVNTAVTYGSVVAENTTGYVVADGATFTVGSDVGTVLGTTTGTGTFVVSENATIDGGTSANPYKTNFAGTLKIADGKTLQLGDSKNTDAFDLTAVEDVIIGSNSWLKLEQIGMSLNNVTTTGGTAHLYFNDTYSENVDSLHITGVTTIVANSVLEVGSGWKNHLSIDKLAGTGSLRMTSGSENNKRHYYIGGTAEGSTLNQIQLDVGTLNVNGDTSVTKITGGNGSNVVVAEGTTLSIEGGGTNRNNNSQVYALDNRGTINLKAANGDIRFYGTANDQVFNMGHLNIDGTSGTTYMLTAGGVNYTTDIAVKSLSGGGTNHILQVSDCYTGGSSGQVIDLVLGENQDHSNLYTGKIQYGIGTSSAKAGSGMNLVLKDEYVASQAVLETIFSGTTSQSANITVDTQLAKVKGITDTASSSTHAMTVSGTAAENNRILEFVGAEEYTYSGALGSNLDIAHTGTGSQSFTGDLSAMNGAVTASAGTLTLDNCGATAGNLESATVNGGTLVLDDMNVSGAVTLGSGTLDLRSDISTIGSLDMMGGTLKLAGENSLTSTGTIAFSGASTLDLTNISLSGTSPVTLATTGGITGDLSAVTLTGLTAPEGYKGVLTQDSNNLVLTFVATSKDLIWDNHASDNQWSTSANWHTEADDTTHIAFTDGDNVRFTTGYTNTSSLSTNVSTGDMTLDSNVTVSLTANSHSLTVDGTLNLGAGSTLEVDSGSRGIAVNLDSVAVDGSASLTSKSGGWNPHFSIGAVEGSAGSVLNLKTNSAVRVATVYDMNGGENSDFHGNIVLRQEQTSATGRRLLAMNINPGAATQLADSVVTLSNVSNDQTRIGLGVNTDATIKGLVSDAGSTAGKHVVFSGQATNDTQDEFNNNINNSGVDHTLTIATDGDNYSTRADVLSNVNLVKTGTGSQSFTGDLSAMNGAVTATAGTLTLDNSGSTGSLASATVNGGTLVLDDMDVTNAVTLSSGKLDLMSTTNIGSLSMTGGTLKLAGASGLTSTGTLSFSDGVTLDLTNIHPSGSAESITLATASEISGNLDAVLLTNITAPEGFKYALENSNNNLVLTFTPLTHDLIWDNAAGNNKWDVATTQNWHASGTDTSGTSTFAQNDNVIFASGTWAPALQTDITAGTMTLESGANLTVDTNSRDLTVTVLKSSGGSLTKTGAGTAVFGGSEDVTLVKLAVSGGSAEFDQHVTVTGGTRVDVTGGSTATFADGLDYSGTAGYGLVIDGTSTAELYGSSDLWEGGNGRLGIASGGKLIVGKDATLHASLIFNSNGNNGDVEVKEGGLVTLGQDTFRTTTITNFTNAGEFEVTGNATSITNLNNSGTITLNRTANASAESTVSGTFSNTGLINLVGTGAGSLAKMNVTSRAEQMDLGAFHLDNGEIHIGSDNGDNRVRNFTTITVDGAGKLTQQSWNNLMHIAALNDGTGEGERSFTWQMTTNHNINSVLYLDGDGAGTFSGTFTADRTANAGQNGAYQGHLQINNGQALQHAVLNVTGANASNYMSVALNTDAVEICGLTGNEYAIVYAGEANTAASGGKNAPESSKDAVLAINVDSGKDFTYAGKVKTRVGVTKSGAGSQSFTGDLSAMNGAVIASAGTLTLGNSSDTAGNLDSATVNGGTLKLNNMDVTNAITLSSGTLDLMSATNAGSLNMTGGTLKLGGENWLAGTGDFALSGGTLDLTSLTLSEDGGPATYTLATTASGNVSCSGVNFTLREGYDASRYALSASNGSLVLTFTPITHDLIWDGKTTSTWSYDETDLNWHTSEQEQGEAFFSICDNVTFESGTAPDEVTVSGALRTGTVTVASGANVTIKAADADSNLSVGGAMTVNGKLTVEAAVTSAMNVTIASDASLTLGGDVDHTLSGAVSGTGDLVKTGEGTATLSGDNSSFTGSFIIDEGTVKMGSTKSLGAWDNSRTIQVNGGGALDYNGVEADTTGYKVTLNGGTLTNTGAGKGSGKRQVVTSLALTDDSYVKATNEMGIIGGGYAATSIDMGGYTLEKTGNSTFYLTNTTISNGGTIKASRGDVAFNVNANDNQLGSLSSNLELAGGNITGNKMKLANSIIVTGSGNGGTVSAGIMTEGHTVTYTGDSNVTVSGVISGTGAVVKEGTGTVTLSGANTYSGDTDVNAGKLLVSSVSGLGTGAVDVASGATLQFDSSLASAAQTGAITLTAADEGQPGAVLAFGGMDSTALSVTGALTLGSGSVLDISGLLLGEESGEVKLATTTEGVNVVDLTQITTQGYEGYTLKLMTRQDGNELWLSYENTIKTLIWDGAGDDLWMTEVAPVTDEYLGVHRNWHKSNNASKHMGFTNYDHVIFNTGTANVGSAVIAGRMTINSGRTATINNPKFDWTVDGDIEGTNASLVINGGEETTNTVTGQVTLKNLTLSNGDTTLEGSTKITGTAKVTDSGTLSLKNAYDIQALQVTTDSTVELNGEGRIRNLTENAGTVVVNAQTVVDTMALTNSKLANNAEVQMNSGTITLTGNNTITGNGQIETAGITLSGADAVDTIDGGQTVIITSTTGISGSTGTQTLQLGDATLSAYAHGWNISGVESVVLTDSETGTTINTGSYDISVNSAVSGSGKLVVEGAGGIVSLNGANSYTGGTEVKSGTLNLGAANALTGTVTVDSGARLAVSGGTIVTNESAVINLADGSTLRLGGKDALNTGTLNIADGTTIDLSNIAMETGSATYVLATGAENGITLGHVDMIFARGIHSETDPTIQVIKTEGKRDQLVLNYDLYAPNGLIWDGGSATWDVKDTSHWHAEGGELGSSVFSTYDDVTFKNPSEGTGPSVATLDDKDIWVTHMHVEAGTSAEAKNTVTVNTNGHNLTVDFLDAEPNTGFVKTGQGTANVGIADNAFGADLTVNNGTLDAIFVGGKNGETQDVSSRVVRAGGELVVTVGDGVDASNVVFDANSSLSGLNDIVVQKGSTAEFKGTTTITQPGSGHASIIAGEGATIKFTGDTTLSDYEITFGGQGSIILGEGTQVSQTTGKHHYVADSVDLRIEKLTVTSQNNDYCIAEHASLTVGNLVLHNANQDQQYYHAFEYNEDDTVRQNETIETLTLGGSGVKRLASISTSGSGAELSQQCGSFTVNKVVMEEGVTSMTLELANCAITTYAGFDEVESFYLGGNGDSDFAGKIRLWDWNKAGTAAKEKDTVMVLNDDVIAARAVIELDNGADNNNFGVGINAANVKVLGFNDAANKGLRAGNDGYIFSGTVGQETNAEYKSDDTARTLELVGDGTYQTTLGLDKNVDLKMSGGGTQKFVGDNSKFDADITVQDGILEFQNTASLTVQDLTLAKASTVQDPTLAKASTEQDLNSVVIKNGDNVGTAEVHGTVKAEVAGAAMASNLTLHADSTLDVRSTLTTQVGEYPDKTDYVGGLDMLGNSLTLHSGAYLSNEDRSALLSMQWGERYELAYGLSSLTLGDTTYLDPIEFVREDYLNKNIEASQYFANLKEADYYICFSGVDETGAGGNVGTLYIFKAPEPTTSTLSLLALAALAARRRRK